MYNRPVGDRRPRRKVRYARNTRIKIVRDARITRIQHDKFLSDKRGEREGYPRATRARVEIYQNRKGLVNIMTRCCMMEIELPESALVIANHRL